MKNTKIVGRGWISQIMEQEPTKVEPLTKEKFIEFWKLEEKRNKALRDNIAKLEKEWAKHWKKKREEHNEEPPMWLVLITAPSNNMLNGGTFYTSGEFIEKHKKWLK